MRHDTTNPLKTSWLSCRIPCKRAVNLNANLCLKNVQPCHCLYSLLVLNPGPRDPLLCIFCISLLFNTPASNSQLIRRALHEWIFLLTWSLHSVHCSLLPVHRKSDEVKEHGLQYMTACSVFTQTKLTTEMLRVIMRFTYVFCTLMSFESYILCFQTWMMAEYAVMFTPQGTYCRIEQTSECIRKTFKICRVGGRGYND